MSGLVSHQTLDSQAAQSAVFADKLGPDGASHRGNVLGHGEVVLELVLGSLGQWALDVLAAVGVNVGHWDLEAESGSDHADLDGLGVLVGGELGVKVQLLALVDHTGVAVALSTTGHVQLGDFVVT